MPMDEKLWQRVNELHTRALKKPEDERETFLRDACSGDEELLREVLRLLSSEVPDEFIEPPPEVRSETGATLPEIPSLTILRKLGEGGRGNVYLAREEGSEELVAVKVLSPMSRLSPLQLERFRREGTLSEKLEHPSIVPVLRAGEEAGLHYFLMPWIDGSDLSREIDLMRRPGKLPDDSPARLASLPPDRRIEAIARIVQKTAETLHFAHEKGVIHRDIKPQNILLTDDLEPHIVDFGLARDESAPTITISGEIEGTPNYMSPEQVHAHRHQIDRRTDVYSLGVVLYELLTLTKPFDAPSHQQVMNNITSQTPRRVRRLNAAIPNDLETICHKAMEKRPEDRYATARDLADDLNRFLTHHSIVAKPVPSPVRLWRWCRRHRVVLSVLLLAILAPLVALWVQRARERSSRSAALVGDIETLFNGSDHQRRVRSAGPLLEDIREFHRIYGEPDAALAAATADLEEWHRAAMTESRRGAQRQLSLAASGVPRTTVSASVTSGRRAAARIDGMKLLVEAALLRRELDLELAELLFQSNSAELELTVTGPVAPEGAEVLAQQIDPVSGSLSAPALLDTVPLESQLLAPGWYRLTVWKEGEGSAELVRWLGEAGRTYALAAGLIPDAEAQQGMRSIAGATVTLWFKAIAENDPIIREDLPPVTVEVDPFLIDVEPVTNGEYGEFVAETGAPVPLLWRVQEERPADWDSRPVTGIPLAQARAYAEWRGARLPTLAEWMLAARGPVPRRFPWGDEPDARLDPFQLGAGYPRYDDVQLPVEVEFDWYVEHVIAAGNTPAGSRGPNDLDQLLGNVWEWTDTTTFERIDGELQSSPLSAIAVGLGAEQSRDTATRRGLGLWLDVGRENSMYNTGFRCAKSLEHP